MAQNDINKGIGYRIKTFRKMNYLRQVDLADLLETSQARIFGVESGKLDVPPTWLMILAEKYNLNPMYVLGLSKTIYLSGIKKGYEVNDDIPFAPSPKRPEVAA